MRLGLILAAALVPTSLIAAPPAEKSKPVDVVLCLDTSSSMDGLLDSAKRLLLPPMKPKRNNGYRTC